MTAALERIPRFVLFDAVGTLIVPRPAVHEIYHQVGCRYGSRLSPTEIGQRFARQLVLANQPSEPPDWTTNPERERARWKQIVAAVFDDVPAATEPIFAELWLHFAAPQHWHLDPQLATAWARLHQHGLRIAIASNFDERLESICRALEPLNQAEFVFHSAGLGTRKPGREFFARIERQLGVPGHALWFVGDDLEADYLGARRAGWQAIWLDRGGTSEPRSPHRASSLAECVEMLLASP